MKADTVDLAAIFGKPVHYVVPLYQRPYVWTRELQWEPLWQDVQETADRQLDGIEANDSIPHFLGAVVLERAIVLSKLDGDRDVVAWEAAVRRLDAEEAAVRTSVRAVIPARTIVDYLRDLPGTWRSVKGGAGRRLLAEALFSEIRALGFREFEFELTAHAIQMGLGAALPSGSRTVTISGYGRGERI